MRLLIVSHDIVGPNLAGPGIRYLELARALASSALAVRLACPNQPGMELPDVELWPYRFGDWSSLAAACHDVDVLLVEPFGLAAHPLLRAQGRPLVVDLYDPFPLEALSLLRDQPLAERVARSYSLLETMNGAAQAGDFFLCAHARQRDWWLGVLQANGRINALTVEADPSLRALIAELPFGLPARAAPVPGSGPKGNTPGIGAADKLILWGGGLWDWLDPLTLIRALPSVAAEEPHARLLFPGTRHPNQSGVPEMARVGEAQRLAESTGLLGSHIFFGGWVPYEAWWATLADADVAVSLHHETAESRFAALRSRVLGHLWARTPLVVSAGDAAADLVRAHGLGHVVEPGDVEGVAAALLALLRAPRADFEARAAPLVEAYRWERVAAPLRAFCEQPRLAPDRAAGLRLGPAPLQSATHQAERARLQGLVEGYQNGRVMRLLARLQGWRRWLPRN